MLYFDRIEEIDVNKTSELRECDVLSLLVFSK